MAMRLPFNILEIRQLLLVVGECAFHNVIKIELKLVCYLDDVE